MQMQGSASLMDRLMGIVTFKAPVYKEVAEDRTATGTAAIIVVVVAVLVGIISGLISRGGNAIIGSLIGAVITQLIGWVIGAWLLAFIAKTFFQGSTDTGEMLRVTGHTSIFNILGIIPILGIVGTILQIIGNVLGIREAAGFDTTKAILTAIIAGVIVFIIAAIITGIFAVLFIGAAAVTGAQ
jgi:hypothetical protein